MKATLLPYLIFAGQCAEAMSFYQSILGGELTNSKYSDSGMPVAEADKDKLIHAELKNDTLTFMGSDDNEQSHVQMGNNCHLSIIGSDEGQLTEFFNKLAEDGTIDTPLAKQAWGDTFGMLTDKFGVHWMVNISAK